MMMGKSLDDAHKCLVIEMNVEGIFGREGQPLIVSEQIVEEA